MLEYSSVMKKVCGAADKAGRIEAIMLL